VRSPADGGSRATPAACGSSTGPSGRHADTGHTPGSSSSQTSVMPAPVAAATAVFISSGVTRPGSSAVYRVFQVEAEVADCFQVELIVDQPAVAFRADEGGVSELA
jgi:hypothetical protein